MLNKPRILNKLILNMVKPIIENEFHEVENPFE